MELARAHCHTGGMVSVRGERGGRVGSFDQKKAIMGDVESIFRAPLALGGCEDGVAETPWTTGRTASPLTYLTPKVLQILMEIAP